MRRRTPPAGLSVEAYQGMYPLDWIRRALLDAMAWRNPPFSFKPILNVLRRWAAAKPPGPPPIETRATASSRGEGRPKRREEMTVEEMVAELRRRRNERKSPEQIAAPRSARDVAKPGGPPAGT